MEKPEITKENLIEALENAHAAFLEALAGVSVDEMCQPKTIGDWSVKDIMAHLSLWESQTIQLLFQAKQGAKPTTLHFKKFDETQQNDLWYQQSKERSFDRVWEDFSNIRDQTIQRLESFSDKEISQPGFFPWLKNSSLGQLVFDYVVEHEKEHEDNIRAWRNPPEQP